MKGGKAEHRVVSARDSLFVENSRPTGARTDCCGTDWLARLKNQVPWRAHDFVTPPYSGLQTATDRRGLRTWHFSCG